MKKLVLLCLMLNAVGLGAQDLDRQIQSVTTSIDALKQQQSELDQQLEALKLQRIQRDLKAVGLPSAPYIEHQALFLAYDEAHEQARWVAHIITPDIIEGTVFRSNDFRPDPLVPTGTAVEEDYFLKFLQPDSTYEYDGYGYDRGHLAPSADFRWSQTALSESYFYSNMSPQRPEFNREAWADLESFLRGYVYRFPESQLYVVTGPILTDDLPKVERSPNGVSIPEYYFKVALDLQNRRGIGFVLPHQKVTYPLETFAMPIDEVERRTGLDFFPALPAGQQAALEGSFEASVWFPELKAGDVEPLYPPNLPPNHFNTIQARRYMGNGEEIEVCGTVVSTRRSRSGNLWMNVDKQFPNQVFSVFIKKKDLINFSYQPEKELLHQQVCFKGTVQNFNGTPTMNVVQEQEVRMHALKK